MCNILWFTVHCFYLESFVNPPVPGTDDGSEAVPFTASFLYDEEESPPPPPGVCSTNIPFKTDHVITIFYDCILGYYCVDIDRESEVFITLRAETPDLEVQ